MTDGRAEPDRTGRRAGRRRRRRPAVELEPVAPRPRGRRAPRRCARRGRAAATAAAGAPDACAERRRRPTAPVREVARWPDGRECRLAVTAGRCTCVVAADRDRPRRPRPASASAAAATAALPSGRRRRVVAARAEARQRLDGCARVALRAARAAPPARPAQASGNGSSAAILAAMLARPNSDSSTPARLGLARQGWQWARWRASWRRSRSPRRRSRLRRGRSSISDLDLLAAPAAGQLVVLLAELAAGPEQGALDHLARHAEPVADLVVGEALELAHDEQLVVALGQAAEGAAQVVERCLLSTAAGGRRARSRAARARPRRSSSSALERHLARRGDAAELVDAGVLGDLVDPRLERDRLVARAQPAQRRDEHLLGDVLGAAVVAHQAEDEGADPVAVAGVQLLERPVVAVARGGDQLVLGARGATSTSCSASVPWRPALARDGRVPTGALTELLAFIREARVQAHRAGYARS